MRVLICTQKVDLDDPVLGFFHRWIEEFSRHAEKISVICLGSGRFALPKNVRVHSLGKVGVRASTFIERMRSAARFIDRIVKEAAEYDAVFVHMNIEYVILGWLLWVLKRKPVFLWYNHTHAGALARLAFRMSRVLFYTSPYAASARYTHAERMPAGIDTTTFFRIPDIVRDESAILFLGRISPVKCIGVLLRACQILRKSFPSFTLHIYGDPPPGDEWYARSLLKEAHSLSLSDIVRFHRGVAHAEAPRLYNAHGIFVNLTQPGSFDKTVIEAAACQAIPVLSNHAFRGTIPDELFFSEKDEKDLAEHLRAVLEMPAASRTHLREHLREAARTHDISILGERIIRTVAESLL